MITHPAEIRIRQYLSNVKSSDSIMSEEVIDRVTDEIRDSLKKQFVDKSNNDFRLRMSNLGRPTCQLWFEKNHPKKASPKITNILKPTRYIHIHSLPIAAKYIEIETNIGVARYRKYFSIIECKYF